MWSGNWLQVSVLEATSLNCGKLLTYQLPVDFKNEQQRKLCFHWANLASLTKSQKSSERAKIIPRMIKRQLILARLYINSTGNNGKTVAIADICDETGALTTAVNRKLLMQQVE